MYLKKNNIFLILLLIILIFFSSFTWNLISISFKNVEIIGEYSVNKHHSLNDPLRYLFFVLTPAFVYLLFKFFYEKRKFQISFLKTENVVFKKIDNKLFIVNLIIIFILLLEFFSVLFATNQIDIFHEGQKLSAAYKNLLDGSLWSGSFVTIGMIHESLGTKLFWDILNHHSIGSMRYLELIYILTFKIFLIYLIYEIIKKNTFSHNGQLIYFLILSLISFHLIDYDLGTGDEFSYRDLPIILFLIIFFKFLNNINKTYLPLIFIGFLSITTFFWSIDRALILNFLLIFVCIYLLFNKKYFNFYLILLSTLFFWFLFYFYLGDEFNFFLENTFSIFKNHNYLHGIIHPTPFSDMQNSSRATKSLVLIILSILIACSFLFSDRKKYNNCFKIILIIIIFTVFCSYIYALGRSDGGHIKQTTGILVLFFSIFIFYNLINFFEKKLSNKKLKSNLFFFLSSILLISFLFILKINIFNILDYPERLRQYIYLNDDNFLSKEQNKFIRKVKPFLKNYKCVQLFTNDAALLYLLKKPNCSRYYFIYSLGSVNQQNDMIKEMRNTRFVIYSGQTDDWGFLPKEKLLPIIDNYINLRFPNSKKILSWEIKYK